jgi:alkanesulfonate monooxygenase SsuD/methylene tetrahydromethanopterin reductase-like flavin-dependent oxidoreductase (luciferase family)
MTATGQADSARAHGGRPSRCAELHPARPGGSLDITIGLPNTVAGVTLDSLLEWSGRAEARDFPGVASLDRLVYPGYEALVSLAAAAAVTERVRLSTQVLLAPWRLNAAVVAKQVATVQHLSGGRMVLGIGLGAREDDYTASGISTERRGDRLTEMIDEILGIWEGEERGTAGGIGPPLDDVGRPQLLVGGGVEASFRRAARLGDGWTAGGMPPDQFAQAVEGVRVAWREEGREGNPRLQALAYFGLGPTGVEDAAHDLKHYYGSRRRDGVRDRRVGSHRRGQHSRLRQGVQGRGLRRAGLLPHLDRPAAGRPVGRRHRALGSRGGPSACA